MLTKVVLAAFLLVFALLPAHADTQRTQDGLKSDHDGPINVKWVEHSHHGRKLVHTLRTYEPWRAKILDDGDGTIQTNISRGPDQSTDTSRVMVVYFDGGRLHARMDNVARREATVIGYGDVTRPDRRTVRVTFPRWFLKRDGLGAYRYTVLVFHDGIDDVPDDNTKILHRL